MPAIPTKKSRVKKRSNAPSVKIDKNMKSHADSPFLLKKEARAKEIIKKYGLPKDATGLK